MLKALHANRTEKKIIVIGQQNIFCDDLVQREQQGSHWSMYTSIWWYLRVLPVLHRPAVVDFGVSTI